MTLNDAQLIALARACQSARTRLAANIEPEQVDALNCRIDKARMIIMSERLADVDVPARTATVAPATDGGDPYQVTATSCTCADFEHRAPGGFCKHRLAVLLFVRMTTLMNEPETQHAMHSAEAPVSANTVLFINGRRVQMTVRSGVTPGQVHAVIGAMQDLTEKYEGETRTAPGAIKTQAEVGVPDDVPESSDRLWSEPTNIPCDTPGCGSTYMHFHRGSDSWFSHKAADGSFHKRPRQKAAASR